MSRKKKFVRNCIFIMIILFANFLLFGRYYFSKEKCLEHLQNTLYLHDNLVLEEFKEDDTILFVLIDEKDETYSFIRMEESLNILYKHSMIGYSGRTNVTYGELRMKINKENSFDYYSTSINHTSSHDIIILHRNNPNIYEIELPYRDNTTIVLNNWKYDYIVIETEDECYVDENKTIKAYDQNHQLIEEIEIQEFFDHFYDGPLYIF